MGQPINAKRMPSGLRDRNSRPCSRKIEIIGGPRVEGKKGVEGKHGGARGREGEGGRERENAVGGTRPTP